MELRGCPAFTISFGLIKKALLKTSVYKSDGDSNK